MLLNKKANQVRLILKIIFYILFINNMQAQQLQKISLEEIVQLANKNSLDAFKAKRQYAIDYWKYKSFKARFLPRIDLNFQPFTYNRLLTKRYDPVANIDVYRQQQSLNMFSELSLTQNIMATGTKVFVNSNFNRLINYGDQTINNYSTTPIRIGINQPLMAFNELKWLNKTALLEYEKAKKDFIFNEQKINIDITALFFKWALNSARVAIAKETKANAERLYKIAKKRYEIGAIEKDDLLNLELESFTSKTDLLKVVQELETVIADLKLFLNKEDIEIYEPVLPSLISKLKISLPEAEGYMNQNNPDLLNSAIRSINAQRDLDKVTKENRFELSIDASYGLNQQSNSFANAYRNFLDQQIVAIRFSMPILDWGERKGIIKTAKMTKEVTDIEIQQTVNDVKRQLVLKVRSFNLQEQQVSAALRAKEISGQSYEITEKRFLSGKVDLLRLLNSRKAWQTATEQYIQSLELYWTYYYEVQQITLYNFLEKRTLKESFESILED
ncbi:MAG: TolC family protein [Flavobacteriaceae bacterium]